MRRLLVAGAVGLLLHFTGICPVVKRIWTPAWTLFSGGLCFLFLAGFCWLTEVKGYRKWALPLVLIGANSIAAYVMAHLWGTSSWIHFAFTWARTHSRSRGRRTNPCCAAWRCSWCTGWCSIGCTGGRCSSRSEGNTVHYSAEIDGVAFNSGGPNEF